MKDLYPGNQKFSLKPLFSARTEMVLYRGKKMTRLEAKRQLFQELQDQPDFRKKVVLKILADLQSWSMQTWVKPESPHRQYQRVLKDANSAGVYHFSKKFRSGSTSSFYFGVIFTPQEEIDEIFVFANVDQMRQGHQNWIQKMTPIWEEREKRRQEEERQRQERERIEREREAYWAKVKEEERVRSFHAQMAIEREEQRQRDIYERLYGERDRAEARHEAYLERQREEARKKEEAALAWYIYQNRGY